MRPPRAVICYRYYIIKSAQSQAIAYLSSKDECAEWLFYVDITVQSPNILFVAKKYISNIGIYFGLVKPFLN